MLPIITSQAFLGIAVPTVIDILTPNTIPKLPHHKPLITLLLIPMHRHERPIGRRPHPYPPTRATLPHLLRGKLQRHTPPRHPHRPRTQTLSINTDPIEVAVVGAGGLGCAVGGEGLGAGEGAGEGERGFEDLGGGLADEDAVAHLDEEFGVVG